jgi:hypothetical protein
MPKTKKHYKDKLKILKKRVKEIEKLSKGEYK